MFRWSKSLNGFRRTYASKPKSTSPLLALSPREGISRRSEFPSSTANLVSRSIATVSDAEESEKKCTLLNAALVPWVRWMRWW